MGNTYNKQDDKEEQTDSGNAKLEENKSKQPDIKEKNLNRKQSKFFPKHNFESIDKISNVLKNYYKKKSQAKEKNTAKDGITIQKQLKNETQDIAQIEKNNTTNKDSYLDVIKEILNFEKDLYEQTKNTCLIYEMGDPKSIIEQYKNEIDNYKCKLRKIL